MIEVKNLTKSFGDHLIWEDVTFDISDGETLAIIGKSGCGKSVFLKHLNALLYPDSGKIYIDGKDLFNLTYAELRLMRQNFGILFQGGALFDSINTFENIAFPLRYFTNKNELAELMDNNLIAFKYCDGEGKINEDSNPNGSLDNIAGIFNINKNILGMMPHPERMVDKIISNTDGVNLFSSLLN